jgi:protease-4
MPIPFASIAGAAPVTREYRLRDVVRAVRGAATDASVKAVVLDLDRFLGGGQAALATLGEAMDAVRRANKPVLVYATGYTDDSYQLAAHASEVWLNPVGAVLLTGPGGSQLFFKGLLDKAGVTPKIYRVGEFKSAVEPFTRTEQSPEARAANQALADALWATWQDDVRRARPKARSPPISPRPPRPPLRRRPAGAGGAARWPRRHARRSRRLRPPRRHARRGRPRREQGGGFLSRYPAQRLVREPCRAQQRRRHRRGDGAGNIVDGKTGPAAPAAPPSPT